jgi:acetyl-CoA synthetase
MAINTKLFIANKKTRIHANVNEKLDLLMRTNANKSYIKFWASLANKYITWNKKFRKTLDDKNAPFFKWFTDGKLNLSYNCLDRHLKNNAYKTAIIYESDNGQVVTITYKELHARVCTFANALLSANVKINDRIIIYLPHSIEAIIAMQACARIGAIHSVVFGGFSAKALANRISDAQAKIIITADGYLRGGKLVQLKHEVDSAIKLLAKKHKISSVIVQAKNGNEINWTAKRDIWWHDFVNNKSDVCNPVNLPSEHPLFILYTSGSTGKPKGVLHSSAGYLLGSILSLLWVFDIKDDDIYWCTADVGWITGHTYVCYGPLALGITQIIFDGVPNYPTPARFWQIITRHNVSIFYTAPTAIRSLMKYGDSIPTNFRLKSLRILGSVGEPINKEAWLWYYQMIGKNNCPIVDTWWQTETGSIMLAPLPGVTKLKPGSCTFPLPGITAEIVDTNGNILPNDNTGSLVITQPFPSQMRTLWNDNNRYLNTYYPKNLGGTYYLAGDLAYKDSDGYFWILGRNDDVLNVSGHRIGTSEIESALSSSGKIVEVAVVGKPHNIKGEAIVAFVVAKCHIVQGTNICNNLIKELYDLVVQEIGKLAQPDQIIFVDALPKTRSGKIMRRLLRSLVNDNDLLNHDISTIENPALLSKIKQQLK